jgi:hypothetical protein
LIRTALIDALIAEATVSALVDDRVYPIKPPRDAAYPQLIVMNDGGGREADMDGPDCVRHPQIRIDCRAYIPDEADALATAVEAYLDGFSGTIGDYAVQGIHLIDDPDEYQPTLDADEKDVYWVSLVFTVWYGSAS